MAPGGPSAARLRNLVRRAGEQVSEWQVRVAVEHPEEQTAASGQPESEESQTIRELLTDQGGYIFHGTRVTGLTWTYRLSCGNLKAVQAVGGHTSPKTALRYQRAEVDYLAAIAENISTMIKSSQEQLPVQPRPWYNVCSH